MRAPLRRRLLAVAGVLPVGLAAACSGGSSGGSTTTSTTPTTAAATTTTSAQAGGCPAEIGKAAKKKLPKGVPYPSGAASAYDYFTQGATRVWFFAIAGSPGQLPQLRDQYDQALTGKGFHIEGTDQEKNHEAESEFRGPHHGTTNFRPLCGGTVVFRLKLTS